MPGKPTILYRSTEISPLGQVADAAYVHHSTGVPTHRILGSYTLVLILKGQGTYADTQHTPQPVRPGDLILLFPDIAHWYGPARGRRWNEFYIVFHGPIFDLWRQSGILKPEQPLFRLGGVEPWLKRLTQVVDVSVTDPVQRQIIMVSRLQSVLADILGTQRLALHSGSGIWIAEVCHKMESELAVPIDFQWLASTVGMSYDLFRKKFAQATGRTPQQYRTEQRLAAARRMLRETEMSLKEIAASLGYYDEFAFSNRFKNATGVSPKIFRQAIKKSDSHPPSPSLASERGGV
jgi:AraC-like DNA-binding protein